MKHPRLLIHGHKVEENARCIAETAGEAGIKVTGVTKAVCGSTHIARAMLRGGVQGLADSRLENLQKLRRELGEEISLMLLRLPMISQAHEVVAIADMSLNSEMKVIRALHQAAKNQGKTHKVVLMIDLGDLREGVMPEEATEIALAVEALEGVELHGLGTNLTCYGGIIPTRENLGQLVSLAKDLESKVSRKLEMVSGGNSSSLHLIRPGEIPEGINNLRVGETILIGNDTGLNEPFPGTRSDTFILEAELIEIKEKPSVPYGPVGRDAFGRVPKKPKDRGRHLRGILAVGEQDINPEGLKPVQEVEILGASSDHLLVDLSKLETEPQIGDRLAFTLDYGSLLRSATSPYVEKVIL